MPEISESAQMAALAIVERIKKGAPDLDLCLISQGGDCRDFKGCTDHAANVLAAIIHSHLRGDSAITWVKYDGTQETLPEINRDILVFDRECGMLCARREGVMWTSATYATDPYCDDYICGGWNKGDLWGYPPTPPAE